MWRPISDRIVFSLDLQKPDKKGLNKPAVSEKQ
jgi:hypothetical protein